MSNEPEHTMIFEVRGDPLTAFREIMAKTDLDDNELEFMRIEIGASKPIITAGQPVESTDESESVAESADESDDVIEEKPHECVCGDRFSTENGLNGHQAHCKEYEEPAVDRPDEGEEADALPGEKKTKLLRGNADMAEIAEEYADDPDPEKWTTAFRSVSLTPETNKWNVAGVLYRTQGRLKTGDIREILEDTHLEMSSSTISQALGQLMDSGVVDRIEGNGWPQYQLTQFGRDLMEWKVQTSDGYQLSAIDKATGVHPTS